jgi:hypothetical protein
MAADELDSRLEERAEKILELLSRRTRHPREWRLRNAELRKNLDRLQTAMRDVQRLRREGSLDPEHERALAQLLVPEDDPQTRNTDPTAYNADSLGLLLEPVDQLLVEAGDAKLICSLLEIEYVRDDFEGGGEIPTWSTLFKDRLEVSQTFAAGGDPSDAELQEARRRLSMLLRARHSTYALRRARSTTKAQRLLWLTPVVAALAAALIVVAGWVGDDVDWLDGLFVALSGALGATLAAVFKLRDQLARLGDLRTFWYAFPLQIPLGAVAGLFLWIVLESGLIEVSGDSDWAVAGAVAFVAGFSEPFLLKTVERIAGGEKDEEEQKRACEEAKPG